MKDRKDRICGDNVKSRIHKRAQITEKHGSEGA